MPVALNNNQSSKPNSIQLLQKSNSTLIPSAFNKHQTCGTATHITNSKSNANNYVKSQHVVNNVSSIIVQRSKIFTNTISSATITQTSSTTSVPSAAVVAAPSISHSYSKLKSSTFQFLNNNNSKNNQANEASNDKKDAKSTLLKEEPVVLQKSVSQIKKNFTNLAAKSASNETAPKQPSLAVSKSTVSSALKNNTFRSKIVPPSRLNASSKQIQLNQKNLYEVPTKDNTSLDQKQSAPKIIVTESATATSSVSLTSTRELDTEFIVVLNNSAQNTAKRLSDTNSNSLMLHVSNFSSFQTSSANTSLNLSSTTSTSSNSNSSESSSSSSSILKQRKTKAEQVQSDESAAKISPKYFNSKTSSNFRSTNSYVVGTQSMATTAILTTSTSSSAVPSSCTSPASTKSAQVSKKSFVFIMIFRASILFNLLRFL
jgi:hypothetical protein